MLSENVVPILRRKGETRDGNGLVVSEAHKVFKEQARALSQVARRLDDGYGRAVDVLGTTSGHVIVCGMGKSGHIGQKIASTLASTGTPSFFMHPGEAYHGDLGMVTERDSAVLISYSGETEEVVRLIPHLQNLGVPIIALVGRPDSTLGRMATETLDVSVEREACPNNLAPTTSTLATMAMGDALAVSLMKLKRFRAHDFARFHPGGSLGRRLLNRVKDEMHAGDLPFVDVTDSVSHTLLAMNQGRLGLALVMDGDRLEGIVTDGDLRRALQSRDNLLNLPVSEIMTPHPVTIHENSEISEAEKAMYNVKLKALVVVDDSGCVTGVLDIFRR